MADKSGGDNTQLQYADQNTSGYQDPDTVAAGGTAAVDATGANALAAGASQQAVSSALQQAALAAGGTGSSMTVDTELSETSHSDPSSATAMPSMLLSQPSVPR